MYEKEDGMINKCKANKKDIQNINKEGNFYKCPNYHINNREKEKIRKFYCNVIGIKSETVLEELAENSRIWKLNAKTLLVKENEKVEQISFLYKTGGIVKAYYRNQKGKIQIHCFAHLPGEPLVGIMNLDRNMTTFLTVEAVTDCEIVSTSAAVIHRLSRESIEVALVCNRMQGISALREYEYRKVILTCTPAQRYEYFLDAYPELIEKVNKKDVASYLNMTPECFSRMLKVNKNIL